MTPATWQKSNYSSAELIRMQQDAHQRAEQMWQNSGGTSAPPIHPETPPHFNSGKETPQSRREAVDSYHRKQNNTACAPSAAPSPLSGLLSVFSGTEHDKLLVLALILLLINEKADSKLILALLWIIL